MPTVEKVSGGRVLVRGIGRFEIGDREDVTEDDAAYLCEERGDFRRVEESDSEAEVEPDESDDVCGYEKDDGSTCQRTAGWGRDADSGRCKDHHEED